MTLLRPSSAERWYNCPGSLTAPVLDLTDDHNTAGREIHSILEKCINQLKESDYQNCGPYPTVLKGYIEYIGSRHKENSLIEFNIFSELSLEQQGKLTCDEKYRFKGTCDSVIEFADYIEIVDYKNGYQEVSVDNNLQLILYAYMAMQHFNKPCTRITIVQQDNVKIKECDFITGEESRILSDILKYQDTVDEKLNEFKAGSWCCYCPLKYSCIHYANTVNPIVAHLPEPRLMSDDELSKIYDIKEFLSGYMRVVDSEMKRRLIDQRRHFKFKKVTEGKGMREWNDDPKNILDFLISQGYHKEQLVDEKLKSFTQIEKIDRQAKKLVSEKTIVKKGLRIVDRDHPGNDVFGDSLVLKSYEGDN